MNRAEAGRVKGPAARAGAYLQVAAGGTMLLIFLVLLVGVAWPAGSNEKTELTEFLVRYVETDKLLEASRLELEAAQMSMEGKAYLSAPSLRMDLTGPYRSFQRRFSYQQYLGELYRGYLESRDESYRISLTLRQKLPSGADLSITGSGHRDQSDFSYTGFPSEIPIAREVGDREFLMDVGISLDQPLFGPWQRKDEVKRERLRYEQEKAQHMLDAGKSLEQALDVFFDYLVERLNLTVTELNLDGARSAAEAGARQFQNGLITEMDLLELKIDENNKRIAHHDARASLAVAARRLRVVTPDETGDLVPQVLTMLAPVDTAEVAAGVAPEVVRARGDVDLARIALAETGRRRYGQTSLSLWYGLQGLGDDFAESRHLFEYNRWGASLSLGLALPEPGLGADLEIARANLRTAESAYEEARRSALEDRQITLERIGADAVALELLTRRVELLQELIAIKRDQYEREIISLEDLVDQEMALVETRIAVLEVMRRLNLCWVDLTLKSGGDPRGVLTTLR
jgi:outer membrane protein TolC